MKKTIVLAAILAAPLPALAASVFDGTWKADPSSIQLPSRPDVYVLRLGLYTCKTCVPAYSVKADGVYHPVKGYPYWDTTAIKVIDARTVEQTARKAGKLVSDSTTVISPDGKTATFTFTDSSDTDAAPVTGKTISTRVGAAPAGAHAMSGSWREQKFESMSDNGLQITLKTAGDSLTLSTPTGQTYTAKLDGTESPYKGDPGITTLTLKQTAPDTLVETDKRDEKVIGVGTIRISADGKTMTSTYADKLHDATSTAILKKQ